MIKLCCGLGHGFLYNGYFMCIREDVTFLCDLKIGWLWFQCVGHWTMILGTIQPSRPIDMQTMYLDFFLRRTVETKKNAHRTRATAKALPKPSIHQKHHFWVWTCCQLYFGGQVGMRMWKTVVVRIKSNSRFASLNTTKFSRLTGWHVFFWKGKLHVYICPATSMQKFRASRPSKLKRGHKYIQW